MPFKDWSTTAGSNNSVGGVSIAELCNPGNLNDAARAIMAEAKTRIQGAAILSQDFGLIGDGSDETALMTAFFNSAITNPGVRHCLEAKTYGISSVLPTISVSDVWIEGSSGMFHDIGNVLSGARIKWVGTSNSGTMLTVTPPVGAGNQALTGLRLRFGINCNSLLANGVRIESIRDSEITLTGANATGTLFDFGVMSGALGEVRDLQRNRIRLNARQIEAPAGICLKIGGDSTANVSMNEFWLDFQHTNTSAAQFSNSDGNTYWIRTNCSGTATYSVELRGGAASGTRCRNEIIDFLTGNKPIRVGGTDTYTVASTDHRIRSIDRGNSTPTPSLGTGATLDCEIWQSYTPTIAGLSGSGLTTTAISASYVRLNGMVDVEIQFQVTAGTGYAAFTATLPFAVVGTLGADGSAKEIVSNSKAFSAFAAAGGSTVSIQSLDGSTALPVGTYTVALRYRVA